MILKIQETINFDLKEKKLYNDVSTKVKQLNKVFINSNEKVSYYYENLKNGTIISYNSETTFYAASTLKILVCIYLYERSLKEQGLLDVELLYKREFKKNESKIMSKFKLDTKHKVKNLIKYSLTVSDNTAYKMLMEYVGIETIKKYGNDLGAKTTMIGKDHYGIVNTLDYSIYFKHLLDLRKKHNFFNDIFNYLINKDRIIFKKSVGNNKIASKGGVWDIAYHDGGIVFDSVPFIICIFTQKGKLKNRKSFINKIAKEIYELHLMIK